MIRRSLLAPYERRARKFIAETREHPTTQAALEWLDRLIYRCPDVAPMIHRRSSAADRLHAWLLLLRARRVTAEAALAIILGFVLMERGAPAHFPTHRHFRHQMAIRLLRLGGGQFKPSYANGQGGKLYSRITVGVRELFSTAILNAIGAHLVAMAAAIENPRNHEEQETG